MSGWTADFTNEPFEDYILNVKIFRDDEEIAIIKPTENGPVLTWYASKQDITVPVDWLNGLLNVAQQRSLKRVDVHCLKEIGLCRKCGAKREICVLSDFSYGEGIFHTEDGKYDAYEEHMQDAAIDEVAGIIKEFIGDDVPDVRRGECFDKVFGISCDPIRGIKLDADRVRPACPACGSEDLDCKAFPEEKGVVRMPRVTHVSWSRLSREQKKEKIYNELKRKGCI